jgi:A/G-specific adenine glycosylase
MISGDTTRATEILDWYDRHRRAMPWRPPPGERADPYAVWLSEIMLQQTTVATVGPYFIEFLSRWPDVSTLAAAKLDDVLHCWQGLGYYARARNLHRCAGVVAGDFGGLFPDSEKALLSLPGIGPYTAAAIMTIAFDKRAVVVDGNVERVMARMFRETEPLPDVKPALRERANTLTPEMRPGDYAQAVMDLGATICIPRRPKCSLCPWTDHCTGRDLAETLPARRPKPEKPTRRGTVFWIERPDGAVLLRRRVEKGLLGGMMEFPSTEWRVDSLGEDVAVMTSQAPLAAMEWLPLVGLVRHTFTHFHLELNILRGRVPAEALPPDTCVWSSVDEFADHALPTVMKKVAIHAIRAV